MWTFFSPLQFSTSLGSCSCGGSFWNTLNTAKAASAMRHSKTTYPEDDGVETQEELKKDIGTFLAIANSVVVWHGDYLYKTETGGYSLHSFVDNTLPRCRRSRTWGGGGGGFDGRVQPEFRNVISSCCFFCFFVFYVAIQCVVIVLFVFCCFCNLY